MSDRTWIRGALLACVLLAVVTAAAFAPAIRNGFVDYDDDGYVSANPDVQRGFTPSSLGWAATTFHAGNWHPLTWLSHMLDWELFGGDPWGHHLTSVALHLANTMLLFALLRRTSGSTWRSAAAAALFGVHPLHVESVAWIAERKDVLSTLFWFLALLAYARYAEAPRRSRLLAVAGLEALALASKPMPVTLPFTLVLLDFWPLRREATTERVGVRRWTALLAEKWPLFALSAASAVVTVFAQRSGRALEPMTEYPIGSRLGNAATAVVAYLGKAVWPRDLAAFYPHPGPSISFARVAAALLVIAAATAAAVFLRRARPYLLFAWLWYLITLLPVIGLVQVGEQAMADRYTYVPLVGPFVAAVWGAADLLGAVSRLTSGSGRSRALERGLAGALAMAVILPLAVLSRRQVGVWRDAESLFTHALSVTRDNHVAEINLGVLRGREGRFEEAESLLNAAVRLRPGDAVARVDLGTALLHLGRLDEAVEQLEEAARLDPNQAGTRVNLGVALARNGRMREAAEQLEIAARLEPGNAEAHASLAAALESLGEHARAREEARRALALRGTGKRVP